MLQLTIHVGVQLPDRAIEQGCARLFGDPSPFKGNDGRFIFEDR
jgi:hypothetical protein